MAKKKIVSVLLVLLVLTAIVSLASCVAVEVVGIAITEDSEYKTEYLIGEDLDITGIKLNVTRSDGKEYMVFATDVREDLRILNFSTAKEQQDLAVIIEYKGQTTSFTVDVKAADAAMRRYTVTFDTGYGSPVESASVPEYGKVAAPEDPTRGGYAFDGWYKEATFNNQFNFSTEIITSDTTLYAKWSKLYYITFIVEGSDPIVKSVKEGATLTDVPVVPPKDGMSGKWSRTVFTNVRTDITVYAEYSVQTFTVNFYYQSIDSSGLVLIETFKDVPYGCDFANEYADEIAEFDFPKELPQNHTHFVGWDQGFDSVKSNLEIIAVYATNQYDVTFDLNYETEEGSSVYYVAEDITYNAIVSKPEPDPVRPGYEFVGWYRQPEGATEWDFVNSRVGGETTLYAKWEKLYTVRFLVSTDITLDEPLTETVEIGGEEYGVYLTYEVRYGASVSRPSAPAKKGHTGSWDIPDAALNAVTNNINAYAYYSVNTYKVTFYNHDHTELAVRYVEYLGAAEPPAQTPVRNGYSFTGWNKEFDVIESDLEVTAQFTPNSYSIRVFDGNVPENPNAYRIVDGVVFDSLITLAEPTYSGYKFAGWYTDSAYVNEWNIREQRLDRYEIKDGVVLSLYAKWIKLYIVTFYNENGDMSVASLEVESGLTVDEASAPALTEKTGYTMAWHVYSAGVVSDEAYVWSTPVTSDVDLIPKYTPIVYTLRFYFPEDLYTTRQVAYGGKLDKDDIPAPAPITINGRTFVRWLTDVGELVVDRDHDIRSEYTVAKYDVTWTDGAGGTITVTQVEHGSSAVFPAAQFDLPTMTGYTFVSWQAQGNQDMYNVTENITLNPVFAKNTYTIRFRNPLTNEVYEQHVYGGTGNTPEQSLAYHTFVSLGSIVDAPSEVGKDFLGWRVTRNGDKILLGYSATGGTVKWNLASASGAEGATELPGTLIVTGENYYYSEASNIEYILGEQRWRDSVDALVETDGVWYRLRGADVEPEPLGSGTLKFAGGLFYAVENDTVFESEFKASVYEFVFRTGVNGESGDEIVLTENYTHGDVVRAPSVEGEDGKVFIGWYTEETFVNSYVFGNPATASATLYARWEEQTASKGVIYRLDGDGYVACGVDENDIPADGIFVVANYYDRKPVTGIDAEAFKNESRMKGIILPATLVSIGPNAFMDAVNLVSIEIPENVKSIPDNCFNGCVALETVLFPSNSALVSIGSGAFRNCVSLNSAMTESGASFPATLTSIGASAFNGCAAFTEITLPASVTDIGDNAFFGCSSLRYAVFERQTPCNLGANVFTRNGNDYNAFRIYVSNLTAYTAESVGANWRALADKLYSSANVDDSGEWTYVTSAGNAVLQQYIGNESAVTVPASLTVNGATVNVSGMADNVFGSTVTEVAIPAGVTISANTFLSATSLTAIALNGAGMSVSSEYLANAYSESATLNTLILRDSSLTLAELFAGSAPVNLKNLILDFNGDMTPSAYANNQYISYVRIGEYVTDVSANAFSGDSALKTVLFAGSRCEEIGDNAFNGCSWLTDFYYLNEGNPGLPSKIAVVGSEVFTGTPWLEAHSDEFVIIGDGILYKYNGSASVITIPLEVKTIAPYAFYANSHIAVVLAEDDSALSTIGEYAFAECASLEAVVIPSDVRLIMQNAFYNASKLATVVALPKTAPELRGNAFNSSILTVYSTGSYYNWISGVRNVQVNNIVTDTEAGFIYSDADASAGGGLLVIKSVDNGGKIVIPSQIKTSNVTQIADYVLMRSATELTVDSALKPVGATDGGKVFAGVTKLTSLTIYYKGGAGGSVGIAASLKSLLELNASLDAIRVDGNASVAELFGAEGALSSNIKSVILTGFADGADNVIADDFLYNCAYVENIYIETENTLVRLEETNAEDIAVEATVGANAFRGTAWMDEYEGDFITVLGGNLIDYKGHGAVAEIPESVVRINGGAFATATDIAVVFIPASVTDIGERAFYGATHVVKVFMRGTSAPALGSLPFSSNPEIFVPAGYGAAYSSSDWASYGKTEVDYTYIVNFVREIGDDTYEQIIFDESLGKLYLYRKYTEIYDADGKLEGVEDYTDVAVTNMITLDGDHVVSLIGANAFVHTVTSVGVSLKSKLTENAFANIANLDKLICYDVAGEPKQQSATLWRIITDKGVREIEYDGSVTLDELLGTTDEAYARPATLTAITISDGVTETVSGLLAGWDGITDISFPESIEKVGPNSLENTAWYAAYDGSSVILGGGLLYKFKGADATVVIPAGVRVINTGAFSTLVWNEVAGDWDTSSTLKVSRIRFETGSVATTILDYAFAGCAMLNSITLPSSMRYIAENAFDETQFRVESDMLIVRGDSGGATLVKYYGSAEQVFLPTEVRVISAGAFKGNKDIISISYLAAGSLLTTVCEEAFFDCTNLSTVALPQTVSSIGRAAFHNTKWLADQIASGKDAKIQNVLYQKIERPSNNTFTVSAEYKSVTTGALDNVSFELDGKEYRVTLDIGTVELASGASISSEELYSLLSTKGVYKFVSDGSRSLSALIGGREPLGNISVLGFNTAAKEIAENYAYGWASVTSVDPLSEKVVRVGAGAFVGTAWYENATDEFVTSGSILIKYNGVGGSVTVGAPGGINITAFTADAFKGNTEITEIIFAQNASRITEIPAEAFLGCSSLTNIVLPANVSVYGENAFAGTPWLTETAADENGYVVVDGSLIAYVGDSSEIVIPQETEYIYPYVFRDNENIVSVAFDRYSLVTEIEANTFLNCANLISITLSESVIYVDRTAFTGTAWLNSNDILYYIDTYNGVKRAVLYVGSGGVVRIPFDVTEISPEAFRGVTTITGIVFTDNTKLTEIPAGAFEGCTSLTTVTLVSAIKTIGDNAFAGTPYLSALTGEFSIVNGKLVRYNGTATEIVLPDTVVSLEPTAFAGNASIVSVDMSATSLTRIPEGAFEGCTALNSVILPATLEYVGEDAFSGTALMSAFNASDEEYFTLPAGERHLLVAAKADIKDVTIPAEADYIPAYVFGGNEVIESVTFTAPVTAEAGAFVGCKMLSTVNGIEFLTVEGDVFTGTKYALLATDGFIVINGVLSAYTGKGGNIVIPAGVSVIKAGVFTGNASITSVSFAETDRDVTIEADAFRNCVNLVSAEFSTENDVVSVGERAFYNTYWAKNYPLDLLVVNGRAVAYFAEGTAIRITADVTEIAPGVFAGNKNIASLVFDTRTTTITIPEGAFMNCTSLNSITFPGSNIVIGKNAFYGTSWYTRQSSAYITVNGMLIAYKGSSPELTIPANVTYIYDYVFGGNTDIISLAFASTIRLTSISGTAFAGCTSLATVTLPASLNYLELTAFEGTPWLAAQGDMIIVGNKLLAYRGAGGSVVIPNSVYSLGEGVFTGNTTITSVSFALGSYVTSIPAEAFAGCTSLASVTFPEGILNVGQNAFKDTPWYNNLKEGEGLTGGAYILNGRLLFYKGEATSYTVPSNVTAIADSAFSGTSVKEIIVTSGNPASLNPGSGLDGMDIYVPADSVTAYKNHTYWLRYTLRIKAATAPAA